MSFRPLISDSEKDEHMSRDQLLKELSGLRAQLAAGTERLERFDHIADILDGVTESVVVVDDAETILFANTAAVQAFGGGRESVEGRCFWDLYPKNADALFCSVYERVKKGRSPGRFRDMSRRFGKLFEIFLYPVSGGTTIIFRDATVDRQKEEIASLGLALLHNMKEQVFLLRGDGRLFHVNNETKDSLGYSGDELHKMSIFDVVPSSCQREWQDVLDRIRQHGSMTFESQFRARDGREFPVEVCASFIELYGSSYYTISARDITERKLAEAQLAYQANLITSVNDAIIATDLERRITSWNSAAERMWGWRQEEVLGKPASEAVRSVTTEKQIAEALSELSHGSNYPIVVLTHTRNGDQLWVEATNMAVRDASGQTIGYVSVNRNITERKQAEESLQVAKAQAELYVDLMGHDINNMNQIAMGSLELALMGLAQEGKLDSSCIPLIKKSTESLTSSSQLIRNVQKLQRASTEGISLKAINATAILEGVICEFRQAPGKELTIDFSRTGDCMVHANELLKDVFINLIDNAVKHARTDMPLAIGISADNIVENGKNYCRFTITDNGPGIPDDVKDRLFRRFSRGETKAHGSGLGLYLVRTLVEHYGGWIQVGDRVPGDPGQGARFEVMIPSVE